MTILFFNKIHVLLIVFFAIATFSKAAEIKLGVDNLIESQFEQIKGKRVALLTNSSGRTGNLEATAEVFSRQKTFTLTSILMPEHGYYSTIPAGQIVDSDSLFGVPAYSLYGKNRRPTWSMLKNVDIVVVDIQDIGIRSYTYISTLINVMDVCAELNKPILILDRPNPLGGLMVDGNVTDTSILSFVSIVPVPYIHGLTIAELAQMANESGWLPKDKKGIPRRALLNVIPMSGWKRSMEWEQTGLIWLPTSPNIPTVQSVRGAATTGIIGELSIVSIGIGTTLPFQYFGLPSLKSSESISLLTALRDTEGIEGVITKFRATSGKYAQEDCNGLFISFVQNGNYKPYTAGINLILMLRKLRPELFISQSIGSAQQAMFRKVTGSITLSKELLNFGTDEQVRAASEVGITDFLQQREKFLLYKE
ncbi:MAG: DUF1343 domain-containing protein [Ignavibacteriae bacterium]|nr:DUF1343 domain-containing protein [Ignavibacteriota bacterium]